MNKKRNNIELFITILLIQLFTLFFFLQNSLAQSYSEPIVFRHYTRKDGLASSYIKSIVQDSDGFIWTADRFAVLRFDGKKFREFPTYDEKDNLVKIYCNKLFLTYDSLLIARTNYEKYYYYDSNLECFFPYPVLNILGPTNAIVPAINGFWICQSNKIFFLNAKTGQRQDILRKLKLSKISDQTIFYGINEKDDWLVFNTKTKLYCYNYKQHKLRNYDIPSKIAKLQYDLKFIDSRGNLWINSFYYGVIRLNLENGHYSLYSDEKESGNRIPHNFVHCFAEDKLGRVWIGTESGLAIYNPKTESISNHNFKLVEPNGLNTDPIYDAFCDKQGNVWLGTYFGGINFWNGQKQYFRTWYPGFGKWQLRGKVVSCLTEDSDSNLWIGLEDKGLNKLNTKTGEILYYSSDDGPNSLSYNNVHDLLFVNDHELWIGTYTGGISILNTKTNNFTYLNQEKTNNLLSNDIYMFKKHGDSIYIATFQGIVIYSASTNRLYKLKPELIGTIRFTSICSTGDILWFSSAAQVFQYNPKSDSLYAFDKVPEMQNINFVKSDSKGRIWIGDCYKGLCCYNRQSNEITYFNPENGFPAYWIFSMQEGKDDRFWVSTDKGLINLSLENDTYKLYNSNSGIIFNQFNYRASFTDSKGNIYFGGNNGMISFNEKEEPFISQKLPVVFTGLQLFNKPVRPGELKCLDQSINKVDKVVLKYNQNVITIEFTAFCYASGGLCQYAYFLEGFEKDWNHVGNLNFATYTNLSPGTYKFRVKAAMTYNQPESIERQLKIIVKPPLWLTGWAYLVYIIIIILIIFLVFHVGKSIEKTKTLAELEHQEKIHAAEIHKVKLEFFTNISHELKTPLTLILGPLEKIIEEEKLNLAFRKRLIGIKRNTKRLYQLINQLLEFQKIENGKENLKVAPCNVHQLLDEISNSFSNLIENRDIDFQLDYSSKKKMAWIDASKVDKIIFNLLSNAFKFTPEGGKIGIFVEFKKRYHRKPNKLIDLIITVTDSGKGIEQNMLDKVFDRFFQIDDSHVNNLGTGIGLAFVKSLVVLHKGTIEVDSIVNKGTSFTIRLPANKEDYTNEELSVDPVQYIRSEEFPSIQDITYGKSELINPDVILSKPIILIVEDNIELISFMKESLELNYQIETAFNGIKALEKLESITPELIISDIMMPKMDGLELTQRLKNDLKLSHIPIVLLTSKSGIESKLEGLKSGADYYLEKPFYPKILEQNIENILNTRKHLIERFKTEDIQFSEIAHSESDKIFIEKLIAVIKNNISNPNLDVTYLKNAVGVSRSLLHLKLKGLVGCSSTEFIRIIRLKEAIKLISSGKCNISEAAYETGFSSPTYFSRCFREFYGKSPREYFQG